MTTEAGSLCVVQLEGNLRTGAAASDAAKACSQSGRKRSHLFRRDFGEGVVPLELDLAALVTPRRREILSAQPITRSAIDPTPKSPIVGHLFF